jgi:hypothetical protein
LQSRTEHSIAEQSYLYRVPYGVWSPLVEEQREESSGDEEDKEVYLSVCLSVVVVVSALPPSLSVSGSTPTHQSWVLVLCYRVVLSRIYAIQSVEYYPVESYNSG